MRLGPETQAIKVAMNDIDILIRGLDYAVNDYIRIARINEHDTKPKEDQIRCGLYRALSEADYLVRVEAAYSYSGSRCDILARQPDQPDIAIEVKTAWAGTGWANKPDEQAQNWLKDMVKLQELVRTTSLQSAYFILLLAFEEGAKASRKLHERIERITGYRVYPSQTYEIGKWNGLNRLQYFLFDVLAKPDAVPVTPEYPVAAAASTALPQAPIAL
jgi:hypothetical protein